MTCEDYERIGKKAAEAEAAFKRKMEAEGSRACPQCKTMVNRTRGCNHIKCKCGKDFCYLCGGDYGYLKDGKCYNYEC